MERPNELSAIKKRGDSNTRQWIREVEAVPNMNKKEKAGQRNGQERRKQDKAMNKKGGSRTKQWTGKEKVG